MVAFQSPPGAAQALSQTKQSRQFRERLAVIIVVKVGYVDVLQDCLNLVEFLVSWGTCLLCTDCEHCSRGRLL